MLVTPLSAQETDNPETKYIVITPSAHAGALLPLGVFTDLTDLGGGAEIGLRVRNILFKNGTLGLNAGYNFVAEHIASVESFGISYITLLAGYTFELSPSIRLAPLVGGGYLGHVVGAGSTSLYFDPQARLQADLSITLTGNLSLSVSPFFTAFFEQSNVGLFVGVNLGLSLDFNVPLSAPSGTGIESILLINDLTAFSPNGDGSQDVLTLTARAEGTFDRFELMIINENQQPVRTFRGGATLPVSWTWDGRTDTGKTALDEHYTAALTLFTSSGTKQASSSAFLLDTVPPEVLLTVTPRRFSPDGDGKDDNALLTLTAATPGDIEKWTVNILDPAGRLFYERRRGAETSFSWDGRSGAGELVQSAAEYPVAVTVTDRAGNSTVLKGRIDTDILIQRFGSRMKIIIPSIVFEGFATDFTQGDPEQVKKNLEILDRLAEIFRTYPGYQLVVEGFAVNVYTDPARMARENREALLPLSQKRADSIRRALIERGFPAEKIKAVGRGNADPVVPYTDKDNQWKNRRVEFILQK